MPFRLSAFRPVGAALRAPAAELIDVYFIGGQSNATGQGYLKNLPPSVAPDPRVLLFHSGTLELGRRLAEQMSAAPAPPPKTK